MVKYFNVKTVGIGLLVLLALGLFLSRTIYSFNMPQVTATQPFSGRLAMTETAMGIVREAEDSGTQDSIDTLQVTRSRIQLDIENANLRIADASRTLNAVRAEAAREVARDQTHYENMRTLYEAGATSRMEMENARNAMQTSGERFERQIADLEHQISMLNQDIRRLQLDIENNSIQMRPYLDRLNECDSPRIIAAIPLENTFIAVGDEARVSNSFRSFAAIVEEIEVSDRDKTVTLIASDIYVDAGESFNVTFTKEGERNERLVPNGAVQQDSQGHFLYRIMRRSGILGDEFFAEKIRIYIGESDNNNTVILNDIGFFEPVVLSSNRPFEEGQTIFLTNAGDFFAQN